MSFGYSKIDFDQGFLDFSYMNFVLFIVSFYSNIESLFYCWRHICSDCALHFARTSFIFDLRNESAITSYQISFDMNILSLMMIDARIEVDWIVFGLFDLWDLCFCGGQSTFTYFGSSTYSICILILRCSLLIWFL